MSDNVALLARFSSSYLFCICVCFYPIDCLFSSLSFSVIHSFLPHLSTSARLNSLSSPSTLVLLSLILFLTFCSRFFSFLLSLPPPALPKFVQRRAQFDSVSLVIQGSMEGEMSLMDNLSGSICHYYALPPKFSKHSSDKKVNNRQSDDSLPPCHTSNWF